MNTQNQEKRRDPFWIALSAKQRWRSFQKNMFARTVDLSNGKKVNH
jgi:hypothetical protein